MKGFKEMIFPVININYSSNAGDFISSWKKLYNYSEYDLYENLLRKKSLESDDLFRLFKWKNNNMNLSGKKKKLYDKIEAQLDLINQLRNETKGVDIYNKHFENVPAIWRIFLFHIIQPKLYPIFDQHVYRAYVVINKFQKKELPLSNKEKFRIYQEEYLPFFREFGAIEKDNGHIARHFDSDIDKALWAFGRTVKQYPLLFENSLNENARL